MSRLTEYIDGHKLRNRELSFATYPAKGDKIVVEGWFNDSTMQELHSWDGSIRAPGLIHSICLRVLAGQWPLRIFEAEAEMVRVPLKLCPNTLNRVEGLKGVEIVPGYSEKARNILGGPNGCSHLAHLGVALGPAAIHGFIAYRMMDGAPATEMLQEWRKSSSLIDSCLVWQKGGVLASKYFPDA